MASSVFDLGHAYNDSNMYWFPLWIAHLKMIEILRRVYAGLGRLNRKAIITWAVNMFSGSQMS